MRGLRGEVRALSAARPNEKRPSRDIALGHGAISIHAMGNGYRGTNASFRIQKISVGPNWLLHEMGRSTDILRGQVARCRRLHLEKYYL